MAPKRPSALVDTRVVAKRLRDVCHLPENEKAWRAGRGFLVRSMPYSLKLLREMPPYEFENWAVNALGGIPNAKQGADGGIDGRIFPLSAAPAKGGVSEGKFDFTDEWFPVQAKQMDKVGRQLVDEFEAAMLRNKRKLGYIVGFEFTKDARFEVDRFKRSHGLDIRLFTVQEILDEEVRQESA